MKFLQLLCTFAVAFKPSPAGEGLKISGKLKSLSSYKIFKLMIYF